jgi:hypothetical protein
MAEHAAYYIHECENNDMQGDKIEGGLDMESISWKPNHHPRLLEPLNGQGWGRWVSVPNGSAGACGPHAV